MEGNVFQALANSDNSTIAILASIVLVQAGIIVYQWRYTQQNTVPKWVFDLLMQKVESILKIVSDMTVVINERLSKRK